MHLLVNRNTWATDYVNGPILDSDITVIYFETT